jgi:putative DNA primase/helicase
MQREARGPVKDVLDRLRGVRGKTNGNGWEALCPAHEDTHRSLGVDVGNDGKVLLSCGRGCTFTEIVKALGMKEQDCWPQEERDKESRANSGKPRITATYDYCDEAGVLRFQVVRLEPGYDGAKKTFRQRRPVDGGGWVWSLAGGNYRRKNDGDWSKLADHEPPGSQDRQLQTVQPILYRLPELLNASPEELIFVPEGEKDVEALRALGLVATTNPMGVGKWRSHFSQALKGRRVVVLPDNDDPGRKHAQEVAQSLSGIAAAAVVLELSSLPPKGDVSDWLALRGTREDLLALAAQVLRGALPTPAWPNPIPASLLQRADPVKTWLVHGYLARGEVTLLSALWKAGKTTFLAHLYRALDRGEEFCGLATQASRVLIVTEESESRWAQRRDELGLRDHLEFLIRPFPGRPRAERWEEFLGHLKALQQERQYDLLVMDTLANLWPVKDENDAAAVQTALMPLHGLLDAGGAGLLLVHHSRKSDGQEATSSRGSGALTAFVDTIVEFRRFNAGDRKDKKRVLTGYGRHDETPTELVVELQWPGGFVSCGGDRDSLARVDIGRVIAGILPPASPGLTADQILDLWPDDQAPRRERFLAALKEGVEGGRWQQEGKGKKGSPYTYWMPLADAPP